MIGIFHISFDLKCYIFRNSAINLIFIICGRLLSLHSFQPAPIVIHLVYRSFLTVSLNYYSLHRVAG